MILVLAGIAVGMLAAIGLVVVVTVCVRLPFWCRELRAEDARIALARALGRDELEPWK